MRCEQVYMSRCLEDVQRCRCRYRASEVQRCRGAGGCRGAEIMQRCRRVQRCRGAVQRSRGAEVLMF